jgi:hypothetical protein
LLAALFFSPRVTLRDNQITFVLAVLISFAQNCLALSGDPVFTGHRVLAEITSLGQSEFTQLLCIGDLDRCPLLDVSAAAICRSVTSKFSDVAIALLLSETLT